MKRDAVKFYPLHNFVHVVENKTHTMDRVQVGYSEYEMTIRVAPHHHLAKYQIPDSILKDKERYKTGLWVEVLLCLPREKDFRCAEPVQFALYVTLHPRDASLQVIPHTVRIPNQSGWPGSYRLSEVVGAFTEEIQHHLGPMICFEQGHTSRPIGLSHNYASWWDTANLKEAEGNSFYRAEVEESSEYDRLMLYLGYLGGTSQAPKVYGFTAFVARVLDGSHETLDPLLFMPVYAEKVFLRFSGKGGLLEAEGTQCVTYLEEGRTRDRVQRTVEELVAKACREMPSKVMRIATAALDMGV